MEGMMYNSPHFHQRDGAMMGTAMVACLSSISYNHADLLQAFILAFLYSVVRSYFTIALSVDGDVLRYVKFNVTLLLSLTLIYLFSRSVH